MRREETRLQAIDARPPQTAAIWRAGKLALLGYALVLASAATVIIGTWGANRPHEVRGQVPFAMLLAAHGLVAVLVLTSLFKVWRTRASRLLRPIHLLPGLVAVTYAGLVLFYFAALARGLVR